MNLSKTELILTMNALEKNLAIARQDFLSICDIDFFSSHCIWLTIEKLLEGKFNAMLEEIQQKDILLNNIKHITPNEKVKENSKLEIEFPCFII